MFRSIASRIEVLTLAFILGNGLAANAAAQQVDSGFLKDYSQLKIEKDPLGVERRIWASPKFTQANYQKILLEPIGFFPSPQASDKVSMEALTEIRNYMDTAMRKALASAVSLSDAPGPGVVRVRPAITAAAVAGVQLKAYQYVPVALALTAAKEASGGSNRDVKLFVESEVTDSVSGEPLALVVRAAQGIQVKSNEKLTLKEAKPQIDKWAESVRQYFAARMKPGGK